MVTKEQGKFAQEQGEAKNAVKNKEKVLTLQKRQRIRRKNYAAMEF